MRNDLPEYLHNLASLAAVLGIFIAANQIIHESGLLAVTVMGMWLANMRGVDVRQILHFKENLSVLLISGLFILLAARLDLGPVVPRPGGSCPALGDSVAGKAAECADFHCRFCAELARTRPAGLDSSPRYCRRCGFGGICHPPRPGRPRLGVAAGAADLRRDHRHGRSASATARPLARLLKVAEPAPNGFLLVGANPPARTLAKALQQLGCRVLLTDSSWENIRAARMDGLPTYFGNPASQHADAHLDLVGLGHLLGLSPAGELNALACARFSP